MKVRFYCDVPPYTSSNYNLSATTAMWISAPPEGWKRIAFDVDLPPHVMREFDVMAPVEFKGVTNE